MSSRALFSLILLLAIVAASAPSEAQQTPKIPKIGYLTAANQASTAHLIAAFRLGLRELGYIEGKTVLLEVRFAEGAVERLPELARELVASLT